ncbi:hypothetical protein [Tsukamurella soli]|uniref:hypothetical protein n=1 Tax=Tsukamurella soli TaxID=644556 RepID=UPI00360B12CA
MTGTTGNGGNAFSALDTWTQDFITDWFKTNYVQNSPAWNNTNNILVDTFLGGFQTVVDVVANFIGILNGSVTAGSGAAAMWTDLEDWVDGLGDDVTNLVTAIENGASGTVATVESDFEGAYTALTNLFSTASTASSTATATSGDVATLVSGVTGSSGSTSDLASFLTNALSNLGGPIDPSRLTSVPATAIADFSSLTQPNLLTNPSFDSATSLDGEGVWSWDGTVGHDSLGSVTATGDGTTKVLPNTPAVAVAPGQGMAASIWVQWSGVAGSGDCFELRMAAISDGTQVSTTTLQAETSPAASGGWVQLAGTYTVPASVDHVQLELVIQSACTAGQVWWDDAYLGNTSLIPTSVVNGLPGVISQAQSTLDEIGNEFGVIGSGLTPSAVAAALGSSLSTVSTDVSNVVSVVQAATTGASNPVAGLASLFSALLGVTNTASTAATTSTTAIHSSVTTLSVGSTQEVQQYFSTAGTASCTIPAAPAGTTTLVRVDVTVIGGSPGAPNGSGAQPGAGGLPGGFAFQSLSSAQVGGIGGVLTVVVGAAGTSGGGAGGASSVANGSTTLLSSPAAGVAIAWTQPIATGCPLAPSAGGGGGQLGSGQLITTTTLVNSGSGTSNASVIGTASAAALANKGAPGSPSPAGAGGAGGAGNITGAGSPGSPGAAGGVVNGQLVGASGAGGGGAGTWLGSGGTGGAAAAPGGGAGGGGGGASGGGGGGGGGAGAPGAVLITAVYQ